MRKEVIKLALGLGLLAGLAESYSTPVFAQWARSTRGVVQVRDVDERGRAPYMQFQGRSCPGGAQICEVVFPAVPAGKRLVLEHVNASINFAAGGIRRAALLIRELGIFVLPVRSTSDPNLSIVNEPTLTYYESGQTPVFQMVMQDGADASLVTVAVSGYLVDLEE